MASAIYRICQNELCLKKSIPSAGHKRKGEDFVTITKYETMAERRRARGMPKESDSDRELDGDSDS